MSVSKERPVIFGGPMVRALLEGRKTQARRVTKVQPLRVWGQGIAGENNPLGVKSHAYFVHAKTSDEHGAYLYCPFGKVGDRLWVRETWALMTASRQLVYMGCPGAVPSGMPPLETVYRASEEMPDGAWRSATHMPRYESRILLEITKVWAEQVRGITEENARAEGVKPSLYVPPYETGIGVHRHAFRNQFALEHSLSEWEMNAWVWAVEFKRVSEGAPDGSR